MSEHYDEDDEDDWPTHNSYAWYGGIFIVGIVLAIAARYIIFTS
jgi:hypothetical protein